MVLKDSYYNFILSNLRRFRASEHFEIPRMFYNKKIPSTYLIFAYAMHVL